jgi:hypothetical protein
MAIDHRALVLGPAARRVPWVAIGAVGAICAAIVWWRASLVGSNSQLIQVLRLAAIVLAASAATCLEDGCETLTVTTPYGRLRRRALTLGLTAAVVVVIWLGVAAVAGVLAAGPESDRPLPLTGLLIELAAVIACGSLVSAAIIARTGWRGSATRSAFTLIVAAICSVGHPKLYEWLWAAPNIGSDWRAGRLRWAAIALASIVATVILSHDPASPRIGRSSPAKAHSSVRSPP